MATAIIDKLAWIEIQEGKILSTLSKGKDVFYIPGGKREDGESDQDALIREIQEELSVELQLPTLSYLGTFEAQAHGKREGVWVRMTCYTGKYTGQLKAASEIAYYVWLTYEDKPKVAPVDQIIFDWLRAHNML